KEMLGILNECTIGIGDPTGNDGSLVTYNSGYVKNGLRIEFLAIPEWLSFSSTSGSIAAYGSDQITITCDAADLNLGMHYADVYVASNDPNESTLILPVEFEVAYGATGGSFALDHNTLSYGDIGVGLSSVKTFEISNSSTTETMVGQITTADGYEVYPSTKGLQKNILNYTIPPSSSEIFNLSFEPSAEQTYNDSVVITSTDPGHATEYILVTGTGVFPEFEIPFSENFNASTDLPLGWEIVDHQGNGQIWTFGTHQDGLSGADGNYAYLNSDSYGTSGVQDADLITPPIDMSNAVDITLSFIHYYRWANDLNDDKATLSYSIDGGNTWVQIQQWTEASTANPATFDQTIPELDGQPDVKIKWNYTGTYDWYWDVDNIQITGTITTLAAPQNLVTTSVTANEVSLSWDAVSGAGLYRIYRSTDPCSGFTEIDTSGTESYKDTNILSGNKYFYYITADDVKMRE
ncbi:MAG: choice-of-anchor J domain-containing protein, partial [Candidatus Delongbacteria bacterium]